MTLPTALLSHYRRHPLQLLALAAMIVLATMLWTGVHHLTSQARASLDRSESAVAERKQVRRTDGKPVTVADFVELRRQGICVMPWLEVAAPDTGRLVGIDPLAAACFDQQAQTSAPWQGELEGAPFVDISEAARKANSREGKLSLLISADSGETPLPSGYQPAPFQAGPDTGELGDSFLLNLDALGVLVLLITALLLRSVYRLGLAQRRESFALLHRFGVPRQRINQLLAVEIILLALLCIVPGIWLGRGLAAALGNGFGAAMENLFDTPLYAGQHGGWLTPVLTLLAVVLVACLADLFRPRFHLLDTDPHRRWWPWLVLLAAGLGLTAWAPGLGWLFLAVGVVFVAFGLLAPRLIAALAQWRGSRAHEPLARWRHKELSVLARRLALPLVALQFALALVLAVQALVTTFENTFDQWLDQRLEADYYIEVPTGADAGAAVNWLSVQPALADSGLWHRVVRGRATLVVPGDSTGARVDVFAVGPVGPLVTDWQLLSAGNAPWQGVAEGQGLMVNEQLARRQGLAVGESLTVLLGEQRKTLPVWGIYPDYGRPAGEILVSVSALPTSFQSSFQSLSVSPGDGSINAITDGLKQLWDMDQLAVRDNRSIQSLATQVFDQTFLLTRAMTMLTLILAGIALLMMGWVFFSTRAWYFRLLMVWGLQRREATVQLMQLSLSLTSATAILALPLGIWLTWVLVQRINPLAFGWSLPMAIYPQFWLELFALSALIGLSITFLMRYQLKSRPSPPPSASALSGGER